VHAGRGYLDMLSELKHHLVEHKADIVAKYGSIDNAPADVKELLTGNLNDIANHMAAEHGNVVQLHSSVGLTADGHFDFHGGHGANVGTHLAGEHPVTHQPVTHHPETNSPPSTEHLTEHQQTEALNQWHLEHPNSDTVRVDFDRAGYITNVHDVVHSGIEPGAHDYSSGGFFEIGWQPGDSIPSGANLFMASFGHFSPGLTPAESLEHAREFAVAHHIPVYFDNSGPDAHGNFVARLGKVEPSIFGAPRVITEVLGENGQPLPVPKNTALLSRIVFARTRI
jgi:hypothetical protein